MATIFRCVIHAPSKIATELNFKVMEVENNQMHEYLNGVDLTVMKLSVLCHSFFSLSNYSLYYNTFLLKS